MARRLLGVWAMCLTTQSCVLPPPAPAEETSEPALLIDYNLLAPITALNTLERIPADKVDFSVKDAIVIPDGAETPNVYWFLAYDNDNPRLEDATGTDFTVEGCSTRITPPENTFVVEALVTYGTVVLNSASADKRQTTGGEPIIKVTWTIAANGDPATGGCK